MMLYRPSPSVTAVRVFSMSAGLAASTVTPGITPPDVSRTTPAMMPFCAKADAWLTARHTSANRPTLNFNILPPG